MATDTRIPTVAAEEIDLSTVRVVVIIPELTVKSPLFGAKEPSKNCTVEITPETRSLQVSVDIKEKDGKVIKYAYKANKLPGDIDTNCKTEYKKGQVILILKKKEEYSWAVQLSKSGLDQEPDT
ncbi:uncharacterized protein LOC125648280 [Ostrea edulis]|uniref:uncharacterized protein LOC125648280 n=1 Tax=Ostrea edulis TaxID=37623 RepID=UPI00209647FC|nr:uncharacterized protein LOC125648280 [Ostrea edulis]